MNTASASREKAGATGRDGSVGRSLTFRRVRALERLTKMGPKRQNNLFTERQPGQPTLQRQWIGCGAVREPIALT